MGSGDMLVSSCHTPCSCGGLYQCGIAQQSGFNFWIPNDYYRVIALTQGISPPYNCVPTLIITWPLQQTDSPIIIGGPGAFILISLPVYASSVNYAWRMDITYDSLLIASYTGVFPAGPAAGYAVIAVPTNPKTWFWTPNPSGTGGWWNWAYSAAVSNNPNPSLVIQLTMTQSPTGLPLGTGYLQNYLATFYSSSGRAIRKKRIRMPLVGVPV
jgi:hypothetical protein